MRWSIRVIPSAAIALGLITIVWFSADALWSALAYCSGCGLHPAYYVRAWLVDYAGMRILALGTTWTIGWAWLWWVTREVRLS
jgi:hypothetical protein